jgi:predicted SprT family Zn-dependent metalloprotease
MTTLFDIELLAIELIKTEFSFPSEYNSFGNNLKSAHDLGFSFNWNNRKNSAGLCNYMYKTVELSKPIMNENLDKISFIRDTILHEIAHALAGSSAKHNHYWKRVAIAIGCNGERCYNSNEVKSVASKYTLKCHWCSKEVAKHRKPKYSSSCKCSGLNRYDEAYKMELIQNY